MRYFKINGTNNSIRIVTSDDKRFKYGVIGTVADLVGAGIFDFCNASADTWAYVPAQEHMKASFFTNKKVCIEALISKFEK